MTRGHVPQVPPDPSAHVELDSPLTHQSDPTAGTAVHTPDGDEVVELPRNVTWLQVLFIAYSFTSSGPFGLEAVVRAAGPLLSIIGVLVIPLMYVVPQICIVTEMACMMPSPHGNVLWVERAFGPAVGYFNGMTSIPANVIDAAVMPSLFAAYVSASFVPSAGYWPRVAMSIGCIALGTVVAVLSPRKVGHVTAVFSVMVVLPFAVGCAVGVAHLDGAVLSNIEPLYSETGTYEYGLYVSTLCWLFTGWRAMGTLGGDVVGPRSFYIGMPLALVMATLTYVFPLMVALSAVVPSNGGAPWAEGYLAASFNAVLPGLGVAISIAGAFSMLGLFSSAMVLYPRVLWGAADCGWVPRVFGRRTQRGVPYVALALHVAVGCVLSLFDFAYLVRLETFIAAPSYILSVACMPMLRFIEPNTARPFRAVRGRGAAIVLAALPIVIFSSLVFFNLQDWTVSVVGCLIDAAIAGSYFLVLRWRRRRITDLEVPLSTPIELCPL